MRLSPVSTNSYPKSDQPDAGRRYGCLFQLDWTTDFEPGLPAKSLLAIELRNQDQVFGIIYLSNGKESGNSLSKTGKR